MSTWIKIDPEQLRKSLAPTPPLRADGYRVQVELSPYDIPDAVRGHYDNDLKKFVIEFRYIGEEPTLQKTLDNHLEASVGKHSGRIYRLEVDVRAMKAKHVALDLIPLIRDGINRFDQIPVKGFLPERHQVTRSVIENAGADILPAQEKARMLELA